MPQRTSRLGRLLLARLSSPVVPPPAGVAPRRTTPLYHGGCCSVYPAFLFRLRLTLCHRVDGAERPGTPLTSPKPGPRGDGSFLVDGGAHNRGSTCLRQDSNLRPPVRPLGRRNVPKGSGLGALPLSYEDLLSFWQGRSRRSEALRPCRSAAPPIGSQRLAEGKNSGTPCPLSGGVRNRRNPYIIIPFCWCQVP